MAKQQKIIAWAKLKFNPKPPERSKRNPEWAPQHYASAVVEGYDGDDAKAGLYFGIGVYSYLQAGDTVMVEWNQNSGKWKFAGQQTPELTAMLNERQSANPELLERLEGEGEEEVQAAVPAVPNAPRPSTPAPKDGAIVPSPGGAVTKQRELVASNYQEIRLDPDVAEFVDVFLQLQRALPGAEAREVFSTARGLVMERGKNARNESES